MNRCFTLAGNGAEICEVTKKNMSEANFFSEFCKSIVARSAERSEGTRATIDVISAPLPRSAERSEALRGNVLQIAAGGDLGALTCSTVQK